MYKSAREKFLGLSLESTRKSYYPQLKKQLETAKENERHLQLLIDSLPARISYVDKKERYVFVNKEYEKAYGLTRDKIVGMHVNTLLGPDNYAKTRRHIESALSGGYVHYEAGFAGNKGDLEWFDITYVPDIDENGDVGGFYSLVLNITEKKLAEEEKAKLEFKLRQVQKFEAIGTLAGGIAHDFNNLLMGIQGRASLISTDLESSHPHTEHIHAIEEYIKSAVMLTNQLLGFARGGKYEVKPIDINELLRKSATMFGRTHKEIKINIKTDQPKAIIEADKSQMEQVLLNMYVNAWQAMPSGGEIFLQSKSVILDEAFCITHEITPGNYVRISVTDTGIGMNEITLQQIFDPFFTTKEKSRGTGLGLASAYGIIKNHSGAISVYSEIGQGTTFNIHMPLSNKDVHRKLPIEIKTIKGSETILLVDDEEMIIDVGKAMLERLGYRVFCANSGKKAVEMMTDMGDEIDLVILDLIMPEMDGDRTFDRIREIKPDMLVILSSGYALNDKTNSILNRGCNGFIQKPFKLSELSQKIRDILEEVKTS